MDFANLENRVIEQGETLARIETKLDSVLKLEKRVDCLERDRAWLKGAYWVLAGLFGLVVITAGFLFR